MLRRLSAVPGVRLAENASISSKGMLGWIALSPAEGKRILEKSERMSREIAKRLKKTALIFSTGAEVANGQVMDTNAPAIRARLDSEGYTVKFGNTLKDDEVLISARLKMAADDGYGLVVITGGVGAEEKDRTIESVLMVDPMAATPAVVKYELGVGRHRAQGQRKDRGRGYSAIPDRGAAGSERRGSIRFAGSPSKGST